MAAKRKINPDAIRDIAAQHVAHVPMRSIGAEYGVQASSISRVLKSPGGRAEVARLHAGISAAENEQADAVRRERERKQAAVRQARKRGRDATAQLGVRPDGSRRPRPSSGASDGRISRVYVTGVRGVPSIPDDDGWVRGTAGTGESESPTQRLNRLDRERALEVESDIAIFTDTAQTSYDYLNPDDVRRASDWIIREVGYPDDEASRHALIFDLVNARSTIDLTSDALAEEIAGDREMSTPAK